MGALSVAEWCSVAQDWVHDGETSGPPVIVVFGRRGPLQKAPPPFWSKFRATDADMSDVLDNSQAVHDAKRAAADLLRAERVGAPYGELAELWAVKVRADERVETLRRRIQPMQAPARRRPPRPVPKQRDTEDRQWMTSSC